MAVSVPPAPVIFEILSPVSVPAEIPAAAILSPFWVMVEAAPVAWVLTRSPFQVQALLPPEQAVKVGEATFMAFIVFVPDDETPPVTLTVDAILSPVVVEAMLAVLAEVASVKLILATLPVSVVACA